MKLLIIGVLPLIGVLVGYEWAKFVGNGSEFRLRRRNRAMRKALRDVRNVAEGSRVVSLDPGWDLVIRTATDALDREDMKE